MRIMKQFDFKINENGEKYAVLNSKYQKFFIKKRYEIFLKKSDIPPFYYNISWDDYVGEESRIEMYKVKKFSENIDDPEYKYKHLYLWGSNSTQKTAIGVNVLKDSIRKGLMVKFVLAGTLINKLMKSQGFSYYEDIENYLNELKLLDILLIDDAFSTSKSLMWNNSENKNIIIAAWDEFIRSFLASDTKLIFTSNTNPELIHKDFGEDLQKLIKRNCFCYHFKDSVQETRERQLKDVI